MRIGVVRDRGGQVLEAFDLSDDIGRSVRRCAGGKVAAAAACGACAIGLARLVAARA